MEPQQKLGYQAIVGVVGEGGAISLANSRSDMPSVFWSDF